MKNIKEALENFASKANEEHALDYLGDYENGFNHAVKLLFPLVEALETYAMTNETFPEYGDVARQALADLKAKLGVE